MVTKKVGLKRLAKLADHLMSGTLGHEKFDFSAFHEGHNMFNPRKKQHTCGTLGCAIGECPVVWPRLWEFRSSVTTATMPMLRSIPDSDEICTRHKSMLSAEEFFDISVWVADYLFTPSLNRIAPWNKKALGYAASRRDVGRAIRRYIKWLLK